MVLSFESVDKTLQCDHSNKKKLREVHSSRNVFTKQCGSKFRVEETLKCNQFNEAIERYYPVCITVCFTIQCGSKLMKPSGAGCFAL